MPLGINPLNDFAFMKTFAEPEDRRPLIGLLNAVLKPKFPIADVTIQNPFNYKDFQDDKLSILDVKAVDASRAWYDVEVQLTVPTGGHQADRLLWLRACRGSTPRRGRLCEVAAGLFDMAAGRHIEAGNSTATPRLRMTDAVSGRCWTTRWRFTRWNCRSII